MTAWLIGIAGTGILIVVVQHLTSGTRLSKTIKTAVVYLFILVLIFPLPSFISGGFDFSSCGEQGESAFDEQLEAALESRYLALVETALDSALNGDGYVASSRVSGRVSGTEIHIEQVIITITGEYADSTSVILTVKALVAEYLNIIEELIRVYVKQA